jgi:hypothetical protein
MLNKLPAPLSLTGSSTMTNPSVQNGKAPSTPKKNALTRRGTEDEAKTPRPADKSGFLDDSFDEDDPTEATRKWESDNPATARLGRSRSGTGAAKAGVNMTLREQEKVCTI